MWKWIVLFTMFGSLNSIFRTFFCTILPSNIVIIYIKQSYSAHWECQIVFWLETFSRFRSCKTLEKTEKVNFFWNNACNTPLQIVSSSWRFHMVLYGETLELAFVLPEHQFLVQLILWARTNDRIETAGLHNPCYQAPNEIIHPSLGDNVLRPIRRLKSRVNTAILTVKTKS